jgi:ABC-type phosphate/phosphonate transport system substrate-binding protein
MQCERSNQSSSRLDERANLAFRLARTLIAALVLACVCQSSIAGAGEKANAEKLGADKTAASKPAAVKPAPLRIGAVASSPGTVTVFTDLCRYLSRGGLPADFVLYSNYDMLVAALERGEVDIAWNTPLAHAQFHVAKKRHSQTLAMRDVDCNFRSVLVARKDSGIGKLDDLAGKSLVLGSEQAAEATVLPRHFLQEAGVDLKKVKLVSLDQRLDLRGNPCSSETHVLKAVLDGQGQAGVIGQRLWQSIERRGGKEAEQLTAVWTTPPFSHCVFTAAAEFDSGRAGRFAELMLAMDRNDPQTRQVMELEGTKKWVAGSQTGFEALVDALDAR